MLPLHIYVSGQEQALLRRQPPVLREYIADASVDLIYLGPTFNSRQDYNDHFAEKHGSHSASQITAFQDSRGWNLEAEHSCYK